MLLAKRAQEVGAALIDYNTPFHFGVGFAAGALGVSPHIAAIVFVGAKAVKVAIEYGFGEALFGRADSQSYGNEIGDLFFEMVGIGVGLKVRELTTGAPAQAAHGLSGKIVGAPKRAAAPVAGQIALPVTQPPMA